MMTPTSAHPMTPTTLSRSELQTRIDGLKAEIQKEEQIKRGAESMQAAWMSSKGSNEGYLKSKENIEACVKNIREKTFEMERLTSLLAAPEVCGRKILK